MSMPPAHPLRSKRARRLRVCSAALLAPPRPLPLWHPLSAPPLTPAERPAHVVVAPHDPCEAHAQRLSPHSRQATGDGGAERARARMQARLGQHGGCTTRGVPRARAVEGARRAAGRRRPAKSEDEAQTPTAVYETAVEKRKWAPRGKRTRETCTWQRQRRKLRGMRETNTASGCPAHAAQPAIPHSEEDRWRRADTGGRRAPGDCPPSSPPPNPSCASAA
jgi:hypothetical protein